jgi:alpha-1,4-digalacturonate transport system substrate-binding protein
MRLRTKIAALCAVVLATSLSACAPGSPQSDAAPSAPASVDFNSFKGQTLTYVYFTDGPDEQATKDMIAKFEAATGAKVNLQIVPFANLATSLQARLSAGNAPEVARVTDWHPYADKEVDFKQYFGSSYPSEFASGAAATAMDSAGRMLAVPSDVTINGPMINVDAFKKAGVPVPAKWTWDELVADAKKVAAANNMPYAFAIDKSGNRLSTVLSQFGTVMIGPDGKNALDKDKAAKALTFFTDLVKATSPRRTSGWVRAASTRAPTRSSWPGRFPCTCRGRGRWAHLPRAPRSTGRPPRTPARSAAAASLAASS